MSRLHPITPADARAALAAVAEHGTQAQAAAAMGITRPALQRRLRRAAALGVTLHGSLEAGEATPVAAQPDRVARYILTTAQSNTHVNGPFLANLRALASHYDARIMVARVRYNHTAQQVAQEKDTRAAQSSLWYAPELEPYFADDRLQLAPDLIWAGDMNILPTASVPLSGLDDFCGPASVIFPHPKIALRSVATAPGLAAKMTYTTGAVTLSNYIARKAGMKAEFHHAYAALIVEVAPSGVWWVRQIHAGPDGACYDLDVKAEGGAVTTGHRLAVLTPGDLHGRRVDPTAFTAHWGEGGIMDTLRPRAQVLHDVLDFQSRSHHNHALDVLRLRLQEADSVEDEVAQTAALIRCTLRPWCDTYVAKANHDEHLDRWLRETDWRRDPQNALFYLELAHAVAGAIANGEDLDPAAWALERAGVEGVRFLTRHDRLELAGVRHDMHGDLGPNGARGTLRNISRTAERTNIGHSHAAGIDAGSFQAGTLSLLDLGYNRGPSSWSHTSIFTYAHEKRALITLRGGQWRAEL